MSDCFPVLKEEQVAQMLQISVATLRRHRRNGKGPRFIKIGGKIRYVKATVEDWIKTNESLSKAS